MKRWLIICILICLSFRQAASAEEFSAGGELKGAGARLLEESADFATTPFTLKDDNLLWTLGLTSVIGLTYAYDNDIRDHLQDGTRNRGLDRLTDIGSLVGSPYLHLGIAALVYGGGVAADSQQWKATGEMLGEALILADSATLLFKQAVGRGRPNTTSQKDDFRPLQFAS
jgi:hypothetical protein